MRAQATAKGEGRTADLEILLMQEINERELDGTTYKLVIRPRAHEELAALYGRQGRANEQLQILRRYCSLPEAQQDERHIERLRERAQRLSRKTP